MAHNPGLLPDEEGYGEPTIEIIEVQPDELLCAFLVDCPDEVEEAAAKYWTDVVCDQAAQTMLKFIANRVRD